MASESDQRTSVLGETTPTKSTPCLQKACDSRFGARRGQISRIVHAFHDVDDVDSVQLLCQIGHFVGERNHGGQQGVGGVFDQFRGARFGQHGWNIAQRCIEFADLFGHLVVESAYDDSVRLEKVGYRASLRQEFRVDSHLEAFSDSFPGRLLEGWNYGFFGGPWHNSALGQHNVLLGAGADGLSDALCCRENLTQIDASV